MREHAKNRHSLEWAVVWCPSLALVCHLVSWVAGALLPAAGMAGRQHPLCVAYHCKRRAMFGKLAGVVFGLGLSAILCMETNPNQPPLACLLGFSGITSLVIMVWLKATAAGLGLGQLQLFAICPTLPPFESCLF